MPCGETCACLAEPGLECLSVIDPGRFGFFADWCRGDDAIQRTHVLNRSRIAAGSLAPQGGAVPASPSVAQSLAIIAKMKACPNWEASSSCGCGVNRCAAGKGRDGAVSHADCAACLGEPGNNSGNP